MSFDHSSSKEFSVRFRSSSMWCVCGERGEEDEEIMGKFSRESHSVLSLINHVSPFTALTLVNLFRELRWGVNGCVWAGGRRVSEWVRRNQAKWKTLEWITFLSHLNSRRKFAHSRRVFMLFKELSASAEREKTLGMSLWNLNEMKVPLYLFSSWLLCAFMFTIKKSFKILQAMISCK